MRNLVYMSHGAVKSIDEFPMASARVHMISASSIHKHQSYILLTDLMAYGISKKGLTDGLGVMHQLQISGSW